ncbi:isoprenylcysteine carboxylmethyltransferase family protein [Flavobacteriaceae bacterium F89]|uniref:Isoprenylcysteine carboxylmethyltransferase family protein n=1 Tax=Cerina litoralis TaxID=2874477 RepID=A0AAE3JSZ1_9FLAO|nr:isoprenylcysteine carboxylmethyltransferase family protein [Cerina litoralis]MCG2461012.1 isoprenylcysteine carboxylmethyltransferase family protein [Cerina litoralis]
MQLRIPPPVVALIFGIAMYLLARFLPFGHFDFFGRIYSIYGLTALAILLVVAAKWQFRKLNTTSNPLTPSKATSLVTAGIYNYSRNPMYLALLLILLAWGLWLGNAFNILLAAGFVGYMNKFQIVPEETALFSKFGKSYHQYCILVRRWF